MRNLEHKFQVALVKWIRLQYPQLLFFAVPNGGHRNIRTAMAMKAEGQLAGCADLLFFKDNRFMAIELKVGKNKPTMEQNLFANRWVNEGGKYYVVYNFDQAKIIIDNFLIKQ